MTPEALIARPLAHRGLHDAGEGVIENSLSAFEAAAAAGYGIELDVQISRDNVPVVFHDATLDRLTGRRGPLAARTAEELAQVRLTGSQDTIPALATVLARVGGRVPVLVEIKDQGGDVIAAAMATGHICRGAPAAIMSFNRTCIRALAPLADLLPLGLTTAAAADVAPDPFMSFVSHDHRHLDIPEIDAARRGGLRVLCWTVRSPQEARSARARADQITFEGFRPG